MRFPKWLIQLSIMMNHITCGPRGYSLCARFYEGRLDGKRVHRALHTVTDRFFWFDPQHCRKAWLERIQG